jgi:hypothetical protein
MTSYLNDGDCVVQILACEQDPRRLFDDISKHVAADRAKHAAVYEARVVIEAPNTTSSKIVPPGFRPNCPVCT